MNVRGLLVDLLDVVVIAGCGAAAWQSIEFIVQTFPRYGLFVVGFLGAIYTMNRVRPRWLMLRRAIVGGDDS